MATPAPATDSDDAHGSAGVDGENKFQKAIAAWKSLDLTKLVSSLDTTAEELVTHQKDALVQRKELAQKTKDFRKMDDSAKLNEMKDLLKAYQGYIDVLTNHSKSVSSAFMQVYSPLSEVPDPYPLLDASIDSLVTTDEVVPRLEKDNEDLRRRVAKLNEQLQEAEQRTDEERSNREALQSSQDSKIKEVEESWAAVLKEKEGNWESRERGLEEKVEHQERLLKELKANYEVSQRLERSTEDTQAGAWNPATAAELEMLNSELERTSSRLADLEARNEQLRVELAQSTGQSHSSERSVPIEEDPAYQRLRSENSSLLRRVEALRYENESEKSKLESKTRALGREVQAAISERQALQTKIERWSDYDEVKRELEMLRAIEFATVEDDDEEGLQANGSEPEKVGKDSLEKLLVARNKKLSTELIELRVAHNELQQRLEEVQQEGTATSAELDQLRSLNATLENDLQKAQQEASNAFETMSVAGTYTSRYPKSSYGSRRGGTSPTSSIIGGFDGASTSRTLDSLRAGEGVGGGSGILPLVTAQRDRFKKKIGELEQELQKAYATVSSLRSEVASLQRDNLQLYEKTRYISTYSRAGQPATSGSSYSASPQARSVHAASDTGSGLSLDRYRTAYEQNMSPLAAFRGRESARALKRMGLLERAVFQTTRMVLATRTSRNLFAVYCLGLHVLVMIMLLSSTDAAVAGAAGTAVVAGGPEKWTAETFDDGAK